MLIIFLHPKDQEREADVWKGCINDVLNDVYRLILMFYVLWHLKIFSKDQS